MKQKWSSEWKSSVQPRKQRKYRRNAPLHVMHKFLGARLSAEHMRQFGRRSLPIRKGDEVRLMRGSKKGIKGVVNKVDTKKSKVYVDGIIAKKVDGSEVMKPLQPSNLMITKPSMDDKRRQMIIARTEERAKVLRAQKPKEKSKPKGKEAEKKPEKSKEAEKKDEPKPEAKKEEKKTEAKTEEKKPEPKKEEKKKEKHTEHKKKESGKKKTKKK
jgi:large subunit ribosomal protein L24